MIKTYFLLVFVLCFLMPLPSVKAQCPQLIWADEFDGTTLDNTKWEAQIGDGCSINLCGWGNNELQYYQAQNATVSDGTLKINVKRQNIGGKEYTSSRLRTRNRGDWTYGRFEARMKLPIGQGIWPAFWMLSTDEPYGGWPRSGEIDIMEIIGSEPSTLHGTVHYGPAWPNNRSLGASFDLPNGTFNDNFHEFAIEWEPSEIRWYIDGYLYSRKTRADVIPWPFDHNFHFLLNVAVGGNWPGNPDGSTIFPQVMEVDYVRVYDGNLAHFTGNTKVGNRAAGEVYKIVNAPDGSTFNWTVPNGATITAGQGTSDITVDWGDLGGNVEVEITTPCENKTISTYIAVDPPYATDFHFINFDDPDNLIFNSTTGNYSPRIANPSVTIPNESALCGQYMRNGSETFDILVYRTNNSIPNATEYVDGRRRFYMDVYSDAAEGTEILIQLESSTRATPANFPSGRHSRYVAKTGPSNQWSRLEFKLLDQPDAFVPNNSIDQLIFLFASNTRTSNTYYFDNFESYTQQEVTSIENDISSMLEVYPNPTQDEVFVKLANTNEKSEYVLRDINGRAVRSGSFIGNETISTKELASGVYLLTIQSANQTVSQKVIKQ